MPIQLPSLLDDDAQPPQGQFGGPPQLLPDPNAPDQGGGLADLYNQVTDAMHRAKWSDLGDAVKGLLPSWENVGQFAKGGISAFLDHDVIVPPGAKPVMLDSGMGYQLPDGSYVRHDQLPARSSIVPLSRDEGDPGATKGLVLSTPGILGALPALGTQAGGLLGDVGEGGAVLGAGALRASRASSGELLENVLNRNAPGFGDRVSTRTPSPVQVPDVHSSSDYQVGADSFNASEGGTKVPYQQRTAELIAQQPGFERFANGNYADPAEVHNAFVDHLADNLRAMHAEVSKQAWGPDSANWYDGANTLATREGANYGTTTRQASGMLARLSPGTPWDMNVAQFNRTANILANHSDSPMTDAMAQLYNDKYASPTLADGSKNKEYKPAWADSYQTMSTPQLHTGQLPTLNDLNGENAGLFIRLHDEAHNPNYTTYNLVKPDGTYGEAMPDKYTPNSNGNIGGAVSIYRDGSLENISQQLGSGHKIRSFHNNIVSPDAGSDITVDTHAMAAANLMPWGASRPEVAYGFGNSPQAPFPPHPAGPDATWLTGAKGGAATGSDGLYPLYAEAYRRVANDLGILPRQLQSMTWEGIKGLYAPAERRGNLGASLLNDNSNLWRQVEDGSLSRSDAQAQILGRGIRTPRWAGGS